MKVLFCGLGSVGQRHLRNLRALLGDDVTVLAYRARGSSPVLNANMTVREGATLESSYNLRSFTQLDEALAEQPDIAFITNPNALHLPTALAAAKAGCHLFIEKPVADRADEVDELLEIVDQKQLITFVAYQFRFHPALQQIKQIVDSGELGPLVAAHIVNGEYLPAWHPYEDYRGTHPTRRDLGGGALRIQTHELDYACWLFGLPRRVFAVGGHLSSLEVDVEDSASVLLQCTPQGRPLPVHIHLDYVQMPPQRVCEVVGDQGKLRFDYYANELVVHHRGESAPTVYRYDSFDRNQMFMGELAHFLACVRGEAHSLIDLREGLASLKLSLAAAKSLETQQVVELRA
jgi:predicted dehydrogenase